MNESEWINGAGGRSALTSPCCAHPRCCNDRCLSFCAYVSCASFSSPSFSSSPFFPDSFATRKYPEHNHVRLSRPVSLSEGSCANCLISGLWVYWGSGTWSISRPLLTTVEGLDSGCAETPTRLLNGLSGGWGWESVFWNSPQNHCLGISILSKESNSTESN